MSSIPEHMIRVIAMGIQDLDRLNTPRGQPSLKYYRSALRQRTRWASQFMRVEFDTEADFGKRAVVTLPVNAELITRAILRIELPDFLTPQIIAYDSKGAIAPVWNWTNSLGNAICSNVQMLINNEIIDEMDSRLLETLDEQTGYMDHFDSTNLLTYRYPYGYNETVGAVIPGNVGFLPKPLANALHIQFPFWWNRGIGPQALPIQALSKDKVQIACKFRPIQECVYTADYTSTNLALPGPGPIPTFLGCPYLDADGTVIPGVSIPTSLAFRAYWLIEYVSLEDREAAAFRMADLQIPIEQHVALQPQTTNGAPVQRIPLYPGGLIRDMWWVCQRVEAPTYNAWFLFSRELGTEYPGGKIWWPNASIPPFNYWDGYARPAFVDRRSDPIMAATMTIRGLTRFEHEAPSFFRSLIPALNCRRTPLVDRYIYRYDFGFWPTGGLAEALDLEPDEMRGSANWSKLPRRELVLNMWQECANQEWVPDPNQSAKTYTGSTFTMLESDFSAATQGFHVSLKGAHPEYLDPNVLDGNGAVILGTFDYQQIRRLAGYQATYIRCVPGGSATILVMTVSGATTTYVPIAMAASGGIGSNQPGPGLRRGGDAGDAIQCGLRGGPPHPRTHLNTPELGGGGGGRIGTIPTIIPGPGDPDGDSMVAHHNDVIFMSTLQSTGGATKPYHGGDGYYGGGSGDNAGGGGGSYVSPYITKVETRTSLDPHAYESTITLTPLVRRSIVQPSFNVYVWLTRINMLRINNGHGALMFAP